MTRYSIIGASLNQVKEAGGKDIKEAPHCGIIFADLEESGIAYLKSLGVIVREIKKVTVPHQIIAPIIPPAPIPAVRGYTPVELMAILGFTEDFRYIFTPPIYGEGFAIAILDSGIRESHELIRGRVIYSKNFTSDPMADSFDHGTGVASIAVALAPKCDLLNMKVLDAKGVGTDETVTMAIEEVIELKEKGTILTYVINLSLGEVDEGNPNDPVRVACRAAVERGIHVVAAAGNSGPGAGTIMSPACERYVGAVGSVGYNPEEPRYPFLVSSFSSRGPTKEGLIKPDAVLPGENIKMASSKNDTATVVKNGTSFAAPIGSALILLQGEGAIKQARWKAEHKPGWVPGYFKLPTPQELLDYWTPQICMKPDIAPLGKDPEYGYGIPFGELASLALSRAAASYNITNAVSLVLTFGLLGTILSALVKKD